MVGGIIVYNFEKTQESLRADAKPQTLDIK
jgi:hypothetical protein